MKAKKSTNTKTRHNEILNYLQKNESVEVSYLCQLFGVSDMTIRRDLEKLEEEKKLIRVYGGARSIQKTMYEPLLSKRLKENFEQKIKIGNYCVNCINDGETIALDGSSTALAMARLIKAKVQVVTNNISIAQELSENENIDIILLGGYVRKSSCTTIGMDAINLMRNLSVDKLFLSSKAIDFSYGVSDATQMEGEIKRAMIESSKHVILMMDSAKLGTRAFYKVCTINEIDTVVTDYCENYNETQKKFIEECQINNIDIRLVGEK